MYRKNLALTLLFCLINRNYNTIDNACKETNTGAPRGHYCCSSVTIRMVDDGPFKPWDYSPFSVKLDATSWLRKDLSTDILARPAGFILRVPMDSHKLGLPAMETGFMCIFSFDCYTGPERKWFGCGLWNDKSFIRPGPANLSKDYAFGSCDTLGVDNAQQWRAQFHILRLNNRS